jgi:hypothetical protein
MDSNRATRVDGDMEISTGDANVTLDPAALWRVPTTDVVDACVSTTVAGPGKPLGAVQLMYCQPTTVLEAPTTQGWLPTSTLGDEPKLTPTI